MRRRALSIWRGLGAGLVLVLFASLVVPSAASASVGPNPHVDVQITKKFDGTGHGTPSQTFVNTVGGFVPGDDADDDGVVSSGDLVGYEVTLRIRAGLARTIAVSMRPTEMLAWQLGKEQFCAPAPGVQASVSGDTCLLTIAQGATAQLTRQLQLTAKDSRGLAVGGQRLAIAVGVQGQQPYSAAEAAEPVTVVSAPSADLVLRGGSYSSASSGSGQFTIEARSLARPGFSPTKGSTAQTQWSAQVDVSAFPSGTTWTFAGQPVSVTGGKLSIGPAVGNGTLAFTMPGGIWPEMEEGDTEIYDANLIVPPTAFATDDYLNNGTGTQPGDGLPRTGSTFNSDLGSAAGDFYPNNDYSAIRVTRPLPPVPADPPLVAKQLTVPRNAGVTLFEPGNMTWAAAQSEQNSAANAPAERPIGTELRVRLQLRTQSIPDGTPGAIVLADTWNPAQQVATGPVRVTRPNGSALDPSLYRVEWSGSATEAEAVDIAVTDGWIAVASPPPGARAVRIVFAEGALPIGTAAGAGQFTATVPMRIADTASAADPLIRDTLHVRAGAEAGAVSGAVRLATPVPPVLGIANQVDLVQVSPGETLTRTVVPTVQHPPVLSDGFASTVTVTLAGCETAPVNLSSDWEMQVTPAVPGPTGRVCSDPAAQPVILTFTPVGGFAPVRNWNERSQTATLPTISYTTRATLSAHGALANSALHGLDGMGQIAPVSRDVSTPVLSQSDSAAEVRVLTPKAEIEEPLRWNVDVASSISSGVAETVIALPRNGDGAYFADVDNPGSFPGAQESSFSGSYEVRSAVLSMADTSVGVELWFTDSPNPSLDPAQGSWSRVSDATPAELARATALKVSVPAPDQAQLGTARVEIELDPTGNLTDDVYLLWAGTTWRDGTELAPMPWPAPAQVVSSIVTGTVWWDENRSSGKGSDEPRIEGVEVGLFRATDGVPAATPLATTTTDADGSYRFDTLHSGEYLVKIVDRGPNLPDTVVSYYAHPVPVEHTYSFRGQVFERAASESTVFRLGLDAEQNLVDFGVFAPEPLVDIDKSEARLSCDDDVCEVEWIITAQNLGNSEITAGTIVDTVSEELYDAEMLAGDYVRGVVGLSGGQIRAGGYAVLGDGRVMAWGENGNGANGNSSGVASAHWRARPVSGLSDVRVVEVTTRSSSSVLFDNTSFVSASYGAYALTDTGQVMAWGNGQNGANGDGTTTIAIPFATRVRGLEGVRIVQVADRPGSGGIALSQDGRAFAWGLGTRGGNGDGSTADNLTANAVRGMDGARIIRVAGRGVGGYALAEDGRVFSWGGSNNGQNGDNSNTDRTTAVRVQGLDAVHPVDLVSQNGGGMVVTDDGRVFAWGSGSFGANGNGSGSHNLRAMPVQGLDGVTVVKVETRQNGAAVLTSTGEVYSWGRGAAGANGNGGTANNLSALPVQGLGGVTVTDISLRAGGGLALTSEGEVFAWGHGANGANGNGSTDNNLVAARVQGLGGVRVEAIQATMRGGLAVGHDGRSYSWGIGVSGANGNGATADNLAAKPIITEHGEHLLAHRFSESSARPPVEENARSGFTERQYSIPSIPAGEHLDFSFRGKVNRAAVDANLLNQVWFTSPSTPIAGLLPIGQSSPTLPTDPGAALDPRGIPGNPTCDTDADTPPQSAETPDSCDQVPVAILRSPNTPGSLEGLVWVDADDNGAHDVGEPVVPGVRVVLVNAAGVTMGVTTTDAQGEYAFPTVPAGAGYTVRFEVLGTSASDDVLNALGLTGPQSYAIAQQAAACSADLSCADTATAFSRPIQVTAGNRTHHINAGLLLRQAGLLVEKTSTAGDPALLQVENDGQTLEAPVTITVTNTGTEPLRSLAWSDQTQVGPDLAGIVCDFDGATELLPGDHGTCTGTLPRMDLGDRHVDRFEVSGIGTQTGTPVSGADEWEASAGGDRGWTLEKTSNPPSGDYVGVGTDIVYTLTATNTGDVTLSGLTAFDDLAGVLPHAQLGTPLATGLARTGNALVWQLPNIAPGGTVSVSYTVTVDSDAWGETLTNSVYGDPLDPPSSCTQGAPCETDHHTPPWPGALPMPVLGNVTLIAVVLAGLALAAAAGAAAIRRRPCSAGEESA